ncbi:MAG: SagB/ThcOx family dehydrogenase [Deltaproteobacteria bacterium]|nr:SagB/ThcOx family dehydrogenase [Deltaproteobacteria bacterium]MBW2124056.1 SagB/ThcOx family dehydrogenase [Deltaproteobacteria bacterium]
MNQPREGIGDRFQRETRYIRGQMEGGYLDWSRRPGIYKRSDPHQEGISLPEPREEGGEPLWTVINKRCSSRDFTRDPISLLDLSQLLWATQGITHTASGQALRACPSAGALYPVETYVAANRVEELAPGIYHYYVPRHLLEPVARRVTMNELASAALGQRMVTTASVVFIWTAVVQRSKWKYRERGYRYIYLDAGHIGQNLYLAATALNLGCCTIGALFDEEVDRLLGVDGKEETVVYMGAVGKISAPSG